MASSSKSTSYKTLGDIDSGVESTVTFDGNSHHLDEELRKRRPSDPTWNNAKEKACWIFYFNPFVTKVPEVNDLAIKLWLGVLSSKEKVTVECIKEIAKASGVTGGKWLVYSPCDTVDEVWAKIAKATVEGKLGTASKVATVHAGQVSGRSGNLHVMCVYTNDFTDKDDVMRVERELRTLGITGVLRYKPDIYTHFNIYYGNKYGIKATIYESRDKKEKKK